MEEKDLIKLEEDVRDGVQKLLDLVKEKLDIYNDDMGGVLILINNKEIGISAGVGKTAGIAYSIYNACKTDELLRKILFDGTGGYLGTKASNEEKMNFVVKYLGGVKMDLDNLPFVPKGDMPGKN